MTSGMVLEVSVFILSRHVCFARRGACPSDRRASSGRWVACVCGVLAESRAASRPPRMPWVSAPVPPFLW